MIHQIHYYIRDYLKLVMPWRTVHAKEMLLYTRFVVERLQRGEPLEMALRHSVHQVYTLEGCEENHSLPTVDSLQAPSFVLEPSRESMLSVTNCPHLLEGRMFSQESKLATISLHGSYLMYLLLLDDPGTTMAMIWTAAHYFIETSSLNDIELRKTWLRNLLDSQDLEESTRSQALMADHVLEHLSQSPLMPRLAGLKESLSTKLPLNATFMKSQVTGG
jgi:hypothetical protein